MTAELGKKIDFSLRFGEDVGKVWGRKKEKKRRDNIKQMNLVFDD